LNNSKTKVFISHASEDKERFVINFSKYLLKKGIDVWLDKWEMLPGDSLVDKIFEEGLKNASAVIVVLSKNSINKKWVREELNSAVINRINKNSKLIPVILDNLQREDIPQSLKDTVWEIIPDINSFEKNADRIIASLIGQRIKPEIGKEPEYAVSEIEIIPELTKIDTIVHKTICEIGVKNSYLDADSSEIFQELDVFEIPKEDIIDSIKILDGRYYIKVSWDSSGFSHVSITTFGFQEYAKIYIPNYNELITTVASFLVNGEDNVQESNKISKELSIPLVLVNHIIDLFKQNGFVDSKSMTGNITLVYNLSPELKRRLS
jgi:hypothetical protein